MDHHGKISLLIVEDDANIRLLMRSAADRSGLFEPVVVMEDGQAALDHLRATETFQLPGLIVSDLSMPRRTGIELLQAMKRDERLKGIPVAIITSSDTPNDRDRALSAGACSFMAKPFGIDALSQALGTIRETCLKATHALPAVATVSAF